MTAPRRIAPLAALVGALAITFVTTVGSPSAAMSGSLSLSDAVVAPGTKVTLSGSLPPQRARTVKLQRRASGSWVTVTSRKSSSTGRFSFTQTSPTSGARTYRVLAPATTLAGKRYAAVATPSRTVTVVRMVDVDAGQNHACAVGSNHRAWCWGENRWGQLGDGTGAGPDPGDPDVSGPVRVVGSGWSSVSATGGSTCGLKTDHTGWCWGDHSAWVSDSPEGPRPRAGRRSMEAARDRMVPRVRSRHRRVGVVLGSRRRAARNGRPGPAGHAERAAGDVDDGRTGLR